MYSTTREDNLLGSGGGGEGASSAYATSATNQPATTASSASLTTKGCSIIHAPFPLLLLLSFGSTLGDITFIQGPCSPCSLFSVLLLSVASLNYCPNPSGPCLLMVKKGRGGRCCEKVPLWTAIRVYTTVGRCKLECSASNICLGAFLCPYSTLKPACYASKHAPKQKNEKSFRACNLFFEGLTSKFDDEAGSMSTMIQLM